MFTPQDVYAALEKRQQESGQFYRWLGASLIGHPCTRYIALKFRCAFHDSFDGKALRRFAAGHEAEARIVNDLHATGKVCISDQQRMIDLPGAKGHAGVTLDGIALVDNTRMVWECKTANDSNFKKFEKTGIKVAKAQYYGQVQVGMMLTSLTMAFHLSENKNDSELRFEFIAYEKDVAENLASLARRIVDGYEGERCNDRPDWFECKWCPANSICHGDAIPRKHCLTCCHSTAVEGGKWACRIFNDSVIPDENLAMGCDDHLYLPWMLNCSVVGYGTNWIEFELPSGQRFYNLPVSSFPKIVNVDSPVLLTSAEMVRRGDLKHILEAK
jgi:hypothetical protein